MTKVTLINNDVNDKIAVGNYYHCGDQYFILSLQEDRMVSLVDIRTGEYHQPAVKVEYPDDISDTEWEMICRNEYGYVFIFVKSITITVD